MTRMARVRPELDALWHVLVAAEAATGGFDATQWSIAQRPLRDTDRWAALPFDAGPAADARAGGDRRAHARSRPADAARSGSSSSTPGPSRCRWRRRRRAWRCTTTRRRTGRRRWRCSPCRRTSTRRPAVEPRPRARRDRRGARPGPAARRHDGRAARRRRPCCPALYLPFDVTDNVPSIDFDRLVDRLGAGPARVGEGLTWRRRSSRGRGSSRSTSPRTWRVAGGADRRPAVAAAPAVAARRARRQRRRHADRGAHRAPGGAAVAAAAGDARRRRLLAGGSSRSSRSSRPSACAGSPAGTAGSPPRPAPSWCACCAPAELGSVAAALRDGGFAPARRRRRRTRSPTRSVPRPRCCSSGRAVDGDAVAAALAPHRDAGRRVERAAVVVPR